MDGQILNFMKTNQFFTFALVASLDISQHLQIAKPHPSLKQRSKHVIFLIERKIHDKRVHVIRVQLQVINQRKSLIVYSDNIRACLQQIVTLISDHRHYLFDAVDRTGIDDRGDSILIRYFRVCRGDNLVFLEDLIFVVRFIDPSNIFDNILRELRPLQMSISIDINRLKEFYQIRHEIILTKLVLGRV